MPEACHFENSFVKHVGDNFFIARLVPSSVLKKLIVHLVNKDRNPGEGPHCTSDPGATHENDLKGLRFDAGEADC